MRMTVLGGSAAGPNTGQGCSGYLVEAGATRLVLDLGPGTLPELRRHTDFRTIDAVVVSHHHLDHVLDLLALRFALAYNPRRPVHPVPLWMPPGGLAFLRRVAEAFAESDRVDDFFSSVYTVAEYDPNRPLLIGQIRITFTPTTHYVPCWAMRVADLSGSRDLVYTADTGPTANLTEFARGAGVLIAEASSLEPVDQPPDQRGHLTASEAASLARDADVSTLVLAHLWEEYGVDPLRSAAQAVFAGRIELARPGLVIEW